MDFTESSIPVDPGTITLYTIEMAICVSALPVLILFAKILLQFSTIHKNLRILVLNQTIAFILMVATRFIIDCNVIGNIVAANAGKNSNTGTIIGQNFVLCKSATFLYDIAVLAAVSIFFVSAIERAIASAWVQNYEIASTRLGYGLVAMSWLVAVCMTSYSLIDESKGREWREHFFTETPQALTCAQTLLAPHPLLITALVVIGLNIVSLALYMIVLNVNKQRYCAIINSHGGHTLSERFQILEIIKSMMLLAPSIVVLFVEYAVMAGVIAYIYYTLEGHSGTEKDIVRLWNFEQLYTLCGVMYALAEPIVRILSHAGLRHRAQRFLCGKLLRRDTHVTPFEQRQQQGATATLRNIAGRQMIFAAGDEPNVYFENYNRAWQTAIAPSGNR